MLVIVLLLVPSLYVFHEQLMTADRENTSDSIHSRDRIYSFTGPTENRVVRNTERSIRFSSEEDWRYSELEYRIPIVIKNLSNFSDSNVPIRIHFDFSEISIKPYNYSIILSYMGNVLNFQITNYESNGTHLYRFDVIFIADTYFEYSDTIYLYYSPYPKDLSSYGVGSNVFGRYYYIGELRNTFYVSSGSMSVKLYNFSYEYGVYWIAEIGDGKNTYKILLSPIRQSGGYVGDSVAVKTGIIGVEQWGAYTLFSYPIHIDSSTVNYSDLEDSVNGLYRMNTHAVFIINNTDNNLIGVYSPLLENATTKRIMIGPIYAELVFEMAPLAKSYSEGTTNPEILSGAYENVTYKFYSYSCIMESEYNLKNELGYDIVVDDNYTDEGFTGATYGASGRYNVSPQDLGSALHYFFWFDDINYPSGDYNRMPQFNGLPVSVGERMVNNFSVIYATWSSDSQGRDSNYWPTSLILLINTTSRDVEKDYSVGSYFVAGEYDGIYNILGYKINKTVVLNGDSWGIDYKAFFDTNISEAYIENRIRALTASVEFMNPYSDPSNVQYINSAINITFLKIWDANNINRTNATIELYYGDKYVPPVSVDYQYDMNGLFIFYRYSLIVNGTFSAKIKKNTDFGELNYQTNITINQTKMNISITIPITDIKINLYDPSRFWTFNNNTTYDYFPYYRVFVKNISTEYINYTIPFTYYADYQPAIIRDAPMGNYTIQIIPDVYYTLGVDISEEYNMSVDLSNTSFELDAYADVARVYISATNHNLEPIRWVYADLFGVNISQSYSLDLSYEHLCDIPLNNRTASQNASIRMDLKYEFLGVNVTNTTFLNPGDTNVSVKIVFSDLLSLKVWVKSSDNDDVMYGSGYIDISIRNGSSNFTTINPWLIENYFVISVPDAKYGFNDLYIEVNYTSYNTPFVVSNMTYLGAIDNDTNITIKMPIVLWLYIYAYEYDRYGVSSIEDAHLILSAMDGSYSYDTYFNEFVYLTDIPSNVKFNITIESWVGGFYLVNKTIMYINASPVYIYFYAKKMRFMVAPIYNTSEGIAGVGVEIFLNDTNIAFNNTDKQGNLWVSDVPSPIYNFTNFSIFVSFIISDYYYEYYYQVFMNQSLYDSGVVIIVLPLMRIKINLTSIDGVKLDGIADIFDANNGACIGTIKVDDGWGVIGLIPSDNVSLQVTIKSRWGYSLLMYLDEYLSEYDNEINIVAPLRTMIVQVYDLIGNEVFNAKVYLDIISGNGVVFSISGFTDPDGIVMFNEIPLIGSIININASEFVVDSFLLGADYMVTESLIVKKSIETNQYSNTIMLPLGEIIFDLLYNSSSGPTEIGGNSVVDIFIGDVFYRRVNLTIANKSMGIPLNNSILIHITYFTKYSSIVTYSFNYELKAASEVLRVYMPIGDLRITMVDMDGNPINNVSVHVSSYAVSIVEYLSGEHVLNLTGVPFGVYDIILRLNTSLNITFEQRYTINFNQTKEILLKVRIRNIEIDVLDENNKPLNGLLLILERENLRVSLFSQLNMFILNRTPSGLYLLSLYVAFDSFVYPLNYTRHPIDVSKMPKKLTLIAKLESLKSKLSLNTTTYYQNEELVFGVSIYDSLGNAITNLSLLVRLVDMKNEAVLTDNLTEASPGYYQASVNLGGVKHGTYKVLLLVQTNQGYTIVGSFKITVHSVPPEVSLSPMSYMFLAIAILLFSGLVAILQYKLSKVSAVDPKKNIGHMLKLYAVGMTATIIVGLIVYTTNIDPGMKILALAAIFLLVVVLYGLWIYMDGYRALKLQKLGKISIALGLVHMVIPIIIMLYVLKTGLSIEWFQEYILEQQSSLGPITAPSLFVSFLSAYVTVYLVVVYSSYRDISRAHKRIMAFYAHDVPESLINSEADYQLMRLSGGIRIRILIFLGLIGLSVLSALPFLQSYAFLIVVVPIVLLIIGPYIVYVFMGHITTGRT